jgi:hypothetical protein
MYQERWSSRSQKTLNPTSALDAPLQVSNNVEEPDYHYLPSGDMEFSESMIADLIAVAGERGTRA